MSLGMVHLGGYIDLVMGQAPPGESCNKDGEGTIFVKAGEFQERSPAIREWTSQPLKFAKINDTLVCVVGATAGKVNLAAFDCAIGRSVAAVRSIPDKLDPLFLYHFLQTTVGQLRDRAQGAAQGVITREMLQSLTLVIPPLPEQRRIATILDQADALRAKRREALAQLDILKQSIFIETFGDPVANPKGWKVSKIEEVTVCLDKLRRPVTESERKPGKVPYYGANGQQGWIDQALFDEPLVLVAEDGGHFETPERGVAYRIDGPAWVNNHAHILRARPEHLNIEFLHRVLRHFNFQPYISGTTRAKLTQGQLNSVKIFVPPLSLQNEFERRICVTNDLYRTNKFSLLEIDHLFTSLQHRAFRGEL